MPVVASGGSVHVIVCMRVWLVICLFLSIVCMFSYGGCVCVYVQSMGEMSGGRVKESDNCWTEAVSVVLVQKPL